jgi:large subunit ribosomal protein L13e
LAATIGIAIDPRRQNLSEESIKVNVARLQEYKKRLILFPRRSGKNSSKSLDASPADVKKAKAGEGIHTGFGSVLPIINEAVVEEVKIKDIKGEEAAYRKLRDERSTARYIGKREARNKAKEAEAEAKKK